MGNRVQMADNLTVGEEAEGELKDSTPTVAKKESYNRSLQRQKNKRTLRSEGLAEDRRAGERLGCGAHRF